MLLLITTLCFFISSQAQNTETDSLKKLLTTAKEDAKKVTILEGLSYAYLSAYPDTALQFALEGLQLAQKIGDGRGEALCTNALGSVYFHVGDYAKALEMYLRYLELKDNMKERKGIAVAYFNLANVYTEEKDYPHALYYLFKAKQEDEITKDSSGILFDLYSLGSIYLRMQKNDSALYYLEQSYQLVQTLDDKNMIAAILNTFGESYVALNNPALATKYYKLSIPYAQAIKDNEVLSSDYYGLAKVFNQQGMLDSSIYYARKALSISQEAPFLKQVMETSAFLTEIFKTKKQFDSAFKYQELSIATKDSLFNVENVRKVQGLKLQEQQRQQSIESAKIEYRNKVKFYTVIFTSAIFLIIALILWRNNKQKQKAYTLLHEQKSKTEQAYDELKSTQAQLIHSEKMASLGELTAGIAHEIQNPLNFVNNFSEVNKELIQELKTEKSKAGRDEQLENELLNDIAENEEKINHHGKRADAIVKGMLQHSRKSSGQKELTDINALADEYLRLSYHGLRAKDKNFNATVKTDFDESLSADKAGIGKINIVPQEIGRVLLNLFNNAFYAVNEKKKLQSEGYEPTVLVSTKKLNAKIEISIKDNGNGIPRKVLDKIFNPFFTTKPTGEGTGLGLSLSYDIIKTHDGEIKVETADGQGATFIIELKST
ncbi:MAG TPA: tetratricopeptide repeat protein [Chitinophagaceae bacterium]